MNLELILTLSIAISAVSRVTGYGGYQAKIPNGDHVPHPCKPNFIWKGVGHTSMQGGGNRNQFGEDFAAAGHKWTAELCRLDSDSDGKTNGEELGDPDCVWQEGESPSSVKGISHPGICDPWGSSQCAEKNSWVNCDSDVFKCPAIEQEDVKKVDLRFPLTKVPAKETTYICMSFDLPSDDEYHMIATTPIINETRVMHHIALIACGDESEVMSEPRECLMGIKGCGTAMGIWTLGLPGECLNENAGFKIGKNGMKRGVLQFHWTNPEERNDLWDASGMTIYFTKKLRQYDAGVFTTGQTYLEIPPQMPRVVQSSVCSSGCTKKIFNDSIYITTGLNHMHYLGISQFVKLTRTDGSVEMLTNDEHYSYDTPVLHQYATPIEVRPGDTLETVCTFRSLSRKSTSFYGEGSFNEMCFGIFNYYPKEALLSDNCLSRKEYEYCNAMNGACNYRVFGNTSHPETQKIVQKVMSSCSYKGDCLHGCRAVVDEILTNHPCFKNGAAENILYNIYLNFDESYENLKFVTAMKSCFYHREVSLEYKQIELDVQSDSENGAGTSGPLAAMIVVVFLSSFL